MKETHVALHLFTSTSETEKIFLDAVISVIILMIISVTTGELFTAVKFPFLYSTQFHLGCIASGMFGAGQGLAEVLLSNTEMSSLIGFVHGLNKVVLSLLSLFIFHLSLGANAAASIIVALSSGLFYSYTITVDNKENDLRTPHPVHDS